LGGRVEGPTEGFEGLGVITRREHQDATRRWGGLLHQHLHRLQHVVGEGGSEARPGEQRLETCRAPPDAQRVTLQTGSGRTLAEHRAHARRHARTQTKCAMRISTSFTAAASVSCQRPESLDQIFPRNSSWHATCRAHGRARQSGPQIHSEPPPTLLVFSVLSPSSTTTECELL
jgi:hypothetical protein